MFVKTTKFYLFDILFIMNKLYLIGGAPTTGKSTLAKYLSKELDIPWISCDQIREFTLDILRKYKSDFPDFFTDTDFTADEFLTKFNAKEISDLEIKQGIEFQKFLQIFIDNSYPWKSFIIEGVNILPEFISQIKFDGEIIPLFVVDEDADRRWVHVYRLRKSCLRDSELYGTQNRLADLHRDRRALGFPR
jgi:2-phosphoglycerate kinase